MLVIVVVWQYFMYQIKTQNKKQSVNKKGAILLLVALLVLGGIGYALSQRSNDYSSNTYSEDSSINYGPPTEEEQQSGDEQKQDIVDKNKSLGAAPDEPQNSTQKKDANVIITFAGQQGQTVEVNAFVSNHIEEGTCTIIFRKGNQTVTEEAPAHGDASTTICTNPEIKRSDFPSSGTWTVQVIYESASAKGESNTKNITIN